MKALIEGKLRSGCGDSIAAMGLILFACSFENPTRRLRCLLARPRLLVRDARP